MRLTEQAHLLHTQGGYLVVATLPWLRIDGGVPLVSRHFNNAGEAARFDQLVRALGFRTAVLPRTPAPPSQAPIPQSQPSKAVARPTTLEG